MPRIRVVVASSADVWDVGVAAELERYKGPGTTIEVVHLASGPASIEDAVGEARAIGPVLDELIRAEAEGCDGAIIYCFGDPALGAARRAVGIPVAGLAEAANTLASIVGGRFGIITAGAPEAGTERLLLDHLIATELAHRCVGVLSLGIPVLGLAGEEEVDELGRAVALGRTLVERGAGALVLGCGGILGLEDALRDEVGVPVIVPAAAALHLCETMLALGVSNCRRGPHAAVR